MALRSVGQFQRRIYEILSTDISLSEKLSGIYLSCPKDAKYPFILISLLKMNDLSKHIRFNYEIEFEICLFEKDNNQERILSIADYIIGLIHRNMQGLAEYQILALRFIQADWIRGIGPNSTKIALSFKALIAGQYE
jgi:hypothetical protein